MCGDVTKLGLILGSGASALHCVGESRGDVAETPWGKPSAPLRVWRRDQVEIFSLARHGEPHRIAPHRINYRANVWALKACEVSAIVSVNTVGGISESMATGVFVLPNQIIDYTWGRESSFFDGTVEPLHHVDVSEPFDGSLIERLKRAATEIGETVQSGAVYAATQGPRLETAAEIDRLERDGCDIVGMTGMPEVALAAELALPYAMLAVVVNPAAGRGAGRIESVAVEQAMNRGMQRIDKVLGAFIAQSP